MAVLKGKDARVAFGGQEVSAVPTKEAPKDPVFWKDYDGVESFSSAAHPEFTVEGIRNYVVELAPVLTVDEVAVVEHTIDDLQGPSVDVFINPYEPKRIPGYLLAQLEEQLGHVRPVGIPIRVILEGTPTVDTTGVDNPFALEKQNDEEKFVERVRRKVKERYGGEEQ